MKIQFKGSELELDTLNLNQLIEVETKFGSLAQLGKDIPLAVVRYIAYVAVKKICKDAIEDEVGACLNLESIAGIPKLLTPEPKLSEERPLEPA